MPLLYQKRILREHLQANPEVFFVFGDNVERRGLKGQAAAMRGMPNALGICTKWRPSNDPAAFFSDDRWEEIQPILERDLEPVIKALKAHRIVVWPKDGIGTGLSRLPQKAPQVWEALEEVRLHTLEML